MVKMRKYGGRGIKVCARWHDFSAFAEDMGPRPTGTSIDRIDNDGDYEPSNCRWVSQYEQMQNISTNVTIQVGGARMTCSQLAAQLNVSPRSIKSRLRRGWTIERVLNEPMAKPVGRHSLQK